MFFRIAVVAVATALLSSSLARPQEGSKEGWIELFNGKDLTGWKPRSDKYTTTKFVDADGTEIKGAKKAKVDAIFTAVDKDGKEIKGAKVTNVDGKISVVDADGKSIPGGKAKQSGGRDAIVGADGKEIKGAKAETVTHANPTGGWAVEKGELICGTGKHGSDLITEQKFTDFELHIEFLATSNSGVYLQGRYEIQVDNSIGVKPKIIEKDGMKIEEWSKNMCGSIYGRIAPSKNMSKSPKEWQSFDVVFRSARAEKGKVTEKARVTLIWNGTKVIDNAEIGGETGAALDGKLAEPGPLLLQGDHGRVTFRNVRIRPLADKN